MKQIDHLGESSCFDSNSISGISINAIKSLLEYKNMSSDVMKKDINSGSQFQFYRTNDCLEISSTKALKESQYDNNLSANGIVTKKPTEQDDMAVKAIFCKFMNSLIIPCDGETNDGKTETSNNNGTKKEPNKGGEAVSLKCQNEVAGRPNDASGSSGGGGDDEDNRKPHVALSNCKRDNQAAENDKKDEVEDEEIVANAGESEDDGGSNDDADEKYECEVEFAEERKDIEDSSVHGGDENVKAFCTNKYMDMDSPIIPCDGETTDGKTETSNSNGTKKESNKGGEAVSLKCQNEVAGRPNNASGSSGGGGDDEDNRKPHVALSNCKRDDQVAEDDKKDEVEDEEIVAHAGESEDDGGSNDDEDEEYECEVESAEERKDIEDSSVCGGDENVYACNQDNNRVSSGQIPSLTCTASEWSGPPSSCARETSTVSPESPKKLKRPVLKVDIPQAKAMQAVTCPPYSSYKNQCHVVREPDFGSDLFSGVNLMQQQHLQNVEQPSNCSARSGMASLQPSRVEEEDELPASPLSASSMPGMSQASAGVSIPQEVLWPLNRAHLSVGDDGSYVENVHWKRIIYIGGGSCGRCYQCMDLKTGKLFAVKFIREDSFEMTGLEIWGTMSGRHDNILELYGAVKSCGKITIFMEYMSGGSIEEAGKLPEGLACHIFSKILSAVQFMHAHGFVHRDIKGANILRDSTGQKVKLADFDTSIKLDNGYQQDNNPRGTEAFMAPEVCRSQNHSFSADIWSATCVLYQMLTGTPPWEQYHHCHRMTLLYQIAVAPQPPPSPACSPEVEDLFSLGFRLRPEERGTASELLNHRAFNSAPHLSNMQLSRSCSTYDSDYESNLCSPFDLELSNADDDEEVSENETRKSGASTSDADHDYDDDADDDVDDYGDDVIGVGDGASGSANAAALVVSSNEGEWQGQRSAALSAEQHLHSLQSDLFFSLPAEELSKLVVTEICEDSYMTDNDVNEVISSEDDFDYQSIIDQISMNASQASRQDGSYSVSDLTKVNITDIDGNIMFSIRERPTTTYGTLGRDLHGNITNVFGIEAFVLVQDDGVTPLDVHAEIGEHEQALRVFRAHDTDDWQPFRWRVNLLGLVEQSLPV
ncbi:probable serine/threonine-protein kinase mps1 isoform X4 [Acropora millepora]|uniref:probable serine/threonine-protein kinase mps1 isoform X4 n=1 Tax=Acropora millepora TaxID=45264 RepID=UPI001CF5DEDA|nr:probable serine/threonine-protein kinase mps1 isoform X4 [Acropora millepora]